MRSNKTQRGFTLLELLLYLAIVSLIVGSLSAFLIFSFQMRIKNQTIAEVEQQGKQVMQLIMQTARNAEAINSPAISATSTSVSFDVVTASKDPTVFSLSGNALRIQEGTSSAVVLTNSRVSASGLQIYNVSRTGTPGIIRIQFILSSVNPTGRDEYTYSKTFYASAALRQP